MLKSILIFQPKKGIFLSKEQFLSFPTKYFL